MTSYWTAAALLMSFAGLVVAGVCLRTMVLLERRARARQEAQESQANALDDAVRMIEARLAEIHAALPAAPVLEAERAAISHGEARAAEGMQDEIEPAMQAAIAAVAAVAVGPQARVRSARVVKPAGDANPWSQQGRMLVQTSHNLR